MVPKKQVFSKYLHVARVKGHNLNAPWEYYNGSEWTQDATTSARLFSNVSEQFSVFKKSDKYYLMSQHHILGGEIYRYRAESPVGNFTNKTTIYCTPQSKIQNLFTYNAFAHTQYLKEGSLLISYNVNSSAFSDLFKNADNYRPYFVRIKGWE